MKKGMKVYSTGWLLVFAAFTAVALLSGPPEQSGTAFWIAYVFTVVALAVQWGCTWFVFKKVGKTNTFYYTSLLVISIIACALMFALSLIVKCCSGISALTVSLVGILLTVAELILILIFGSAGKTWACMDTEERKAVKTMQTLTDQAEILNHSVENPELKRETQKIWEALRFSNSCTPISAYGLNEQAHSQFKAFKEAVEDADMERVRIEGSQLLIILEERNAVCKNRDSR